tara:strand:- start:4805 stop:5278 length:474 start_codon:yes stop_codon:yes gene_type:complete
MKIKKIIIGLLLLLLTNCGFEPIYSEKKLASNFNFSIQKIDFLNESATNQIIINKLDRYRNLKDKTKKLELKINTSTDKIVASKNLKGETEVFTMEVTINLEVSKNNNIIEKRIFQENFNYKNKTNKFDLDEYEAKIKKNLVTRISNEIIAYLYDVK